MTNKRNLTQSDLRSAIEAAAASETARISELGPDECNRIAGGQTDQPIGYYDPSQFGQKPN